LDVGLEILTAVGGSADNAWFGLLVAFVLVPLVGRVFLAWAPAGSPGSHTPRDLPTTWAASCLLGTAWFVCGLALAPRTFDGAIVSAGSIFVLLAAVPVAALIVRLITAPGGLVPRHEPVREHVPTAVTFRIVVVVLATPVLAVRADPAQSWMHVGVPAFAAAILAHEALAQARVSAGLRVAALALVMLVICGVPAEPPAVVGYASLGAAGLAAGTVGWIRRGDRRALVVASVGLVLLARTSPEGIVVAIAAAACIVIGSAQPSRRRAATWMVIAAVVGGIARSESVRHTIAAPGAAAEHRHVEWTLLASVAAAFLAAWMLRRKREPAEHNPSGAPIGREAFVLGAAAVLAFVALLAMGGWASPDRSEAATRLPEWFGAAWILLVIAAAIALSRALERPPRTR